MRRIDYRSGLWFAAATIPGAILGVLTADVIPRRLFDGIFGVLMVAAAAFLFLNRPKKSRRAAPGSRYLAVRSLTEKDGTAHSYAFDARTGVGLSLGVGYLSSLLGIGGGIIHVPALVRRLNFPVHIATATSHFILAITALAGTLMHVAIGSYTLDSARQTALLGVGVLLGAPLGAALSNRVRGAWIIRALAVALAFVGLRIFLKAM
jgi:hypothetical protein